VGHRLTHSHSLADVEINNMPNLSDVSRPLLLDGGTGRELLKRRVPILTHQWASTALTIAPDIVRSVHRDFIDAGADIITTNTFGLVRENLAKDGLEREFAALNRTAARLAAEARDQSGKPVAIAASLPPRTHCYRPDLTREIEDLLPLYREQVEILAPSVDLFICETVPSGKEAVAAATAAIESGKPVWVSWSLDDDNSGRLRSGETVSEAAKRLSHLPVEGFLCNCCTPESITAALPELSSIGRGRWGGYANTFLPIDASGPTYGERKLDPADWERYEAAALPFRDDMPPELFAQYAGTWLDRGAGLLGGCCGAGPEYIARLRALIDGAEPSLSPQRAGESRRVH
jgi:S-methylmethionine-dependent homocysteine/selenocysteine methylase